MKLLCLAPTYGREPRILNNTLKCFLDQTHVDKYLILYDDYGNTPNSEGDNWLSYSTSNREPSLSEKYMSMLELAKYRGISYDGVCVWDDDDIYLEDHLKYTSDILESSKWSKPGFIRSTYGQKDGETVLENALGRFHGSIGLRKEFLQEIGGWPRTKRMDYDQMFMGFAAKAATPGDYCKSESPQYVYGWGLWGHAVHCSLLGNDENWYENYKPKYSKLIPELGPKYSDRTAQIIKALEV